jgi:3-oxoisoapionate decarboxylase
MTIRIGLDSFSYHRYFGEIGVYEQPTAIRWTTDDFLRRAHELGLDAVALQTIYMPDFNANTVAELRRKLDKLGLEPTISWGHRPGLEGGTNPAKVADLMRTLPLAKTLGCSLVRFVCGDMLTWAIPVEERLRNLKPIIQDAAAEAKQLGLDLAIENHADLAMRDIVTLVESVGADNFGICFDTVNCVRVGDIFEEAVQIALPHIRMVHIKDLIALPESKGNPAAFWPSAPLGRGQLDLPYLIEQLESVNYAGRLFVEMAYMHPTYTDEDAAVAESVAYLKNYFNQH